MEVNKIKIDYSIINEQKELYNIQILSIGSNQDENYIKLFGDIILPDKFDKSLIIKVILYDRNDEIINTSIFSGIGNSEERFLTFSFDFFKYLNQKATKAKFFLLEKKR